MFIIGSFNKFFGGYNRNMIDGYGGYLSCIMHGLRMADGAMVLRERNLG